MTESSVTALDERILGFDARALGQYAQAPNRLLLRADVARPLSVDVTIWPSIFHVSDMVDRIVTFDPIPCESCTGWEGIVCDHLDELQTRLAGLTGTSSPAYAVIAVTSWRAAADATARPDEAWPPLGFDVADQWLTSSLTNMWSSDTWPRARERYAGRLNEHHLFPLVDDARDFRADSDTRIPSHAPFFVYGLYEVTARGSRS